MQRPTGVTILAVLAIIFGALGILGAITLIGGGALIAGSSGVSGGLITILGVITLVTSVLALAFGIGAWTLKPWAWILGVANYIISLVVSVLFIVTGISTVGGQIVSIVIAAAILYYLFTPTVKQAFGRA
ncbi:MAG: hypothetical protein ACJ8CR_03695 [Roseiflexaceae bacterium]